MANSSAERALYSGLGMVRGTVFQAGKLLMLKTGEQVSLTIKSPRNEGADVLATGPIPNPIDWFADD